MVIEIVCEACGWLAITSQPANQVWAEHVDACPAVGGAVRYMPELPPLPQLLPEIRVCRHRLVRRQIAVTPGRRQAVCGRVRALRPPSRRGVTFSGMNGLCACLAAAVVAAPGTVSASVGTLHFAYPARFAHLDLGRGSAVLVADYPLSMDSPTVRTATFPANGVVFLLSREPKLSPPVPASSVGFPLSLSRLGPSQRHPNGQTWELRFRRNGDVYRVTVWYGNTASARDRAAIASVVSSIRAR